jgi:2-methylcitrate dehydratase
MGGLAVEQIAAFADRARPDHLSSEVRELFKRNILDSLGCALGALPGKPFARLRQQLRQPSRPRCEASSDGRANRRPVPARDVSQLKEHLCHW